MAFVSKKHKFVFVHIPKTGGTSISVALIESHNAKVRGNADRLKHVGIGGNIPKVFRPNDIDVHDTICEIHNKFPESKGYKSFCVVRNPWERIFSFYQHKKRINDPNLPSGSFSEIFKKSNFLLLQPQTFWMRSENGKIEIDSIIKMESLENDFNEFAESVGMNASLPHLNKSKKEDYREHYDDYTKKLIGEYYKHEIELFGYKF